MPGRLGGGRPKHEVFIEGVWRLSVRYLPLQKTPSAEGHASQWELLMGEIGSGADRPWTIEAVQELISLARERMPAAIMSLKLCQRLLAKLPWPTYW